LPQVNENFESAKADGVATAIASAIKAEISNGEPETARDVVLDEEFRIAFSRSRDCVSYQRDSNLARTNGQKQPDATNRG